MFRKFRKFFFLAGLTVSMFVFSVVGVFAQETENPTYSDIVTTVTTWVEGSPLFAVVVGVIIVGIGVGVLRRMMRGTV